MPKKSKITRATEGAARIVLREEVKMNKGESGRVLTDGKRSNGKELTKG